MMFARKAVYLGVAAALSIAAGSVQAQVELPPYFVGTVKCEGVTSTGAKYVHAPFSVSLWPAAPGIFVKDRWGTDMGVSYFAIPFGLASTGGTVGIVAVDGAEGAYSETGELKLSQDKKSGKFKLDGETHVVADSVAVAGGVAAECDWKLHAAEPPRP